LINGALVGVLALIGGGTWFALRPASATGSSSTGTVRTATATTGTVQATISAQGNIEAATTASPAFSVSGTVKTVDVGVGDTVKKGQLLGTLDPADLEDAVTQAKEQLTSAKQQLSTATLQRTSAQQSVDEATAAYADITTTTDPKTGTTTTSRRGTQSQITSAKAQLSSARGQVSSATSSVTQAETALATAEAAVGKATLTAPISGVITAVSSTVGSSVSVGGASSGAAASSTAASSATASTTSASTTSSGFVTIDDPATLQVRASFAEADAAQLSVGQAASVTFPAVTDVTATAKVTAIAPTGTTSNGVVTYAGTVTLDKRPEGVRLGQTASVSVTTAKATKVVSVPSNAVTVGTITNGKTAGTVTVVAADGTQKVTNVTIGVQGDTSTEISSGLTVGDKVVISLDTSVGAVTSNQSGLGGIGGGFNGPPSGFGGQG